MTWALLGLLALALATAAYQTYRLGKSQDGESRATKMYVDQVGVTKSRDETILDLQSGIRVLVAENTVMRSQLAEAKARLVKAEIRAHNAEQKLASKAAKEVETDAEPADVLDAFNAGVQAGHDAMQAGRAGAGDRRADSVQPEGTASDGTDAAG